MNWKSVRRFGVVVLASIEEFLQGSGWDMILDSNDYYFLGDTFSEEEIKFLVSEIEKQIKS